MTSPSAPTSLGRYEVRRRLGSGAFATVWLAHDQVLDSEVAIKVLADNWAHDPDLRRRFLAEGRLLRRVRSPYVIEVHDAGQLDDERPYLVMGHADRGTVADLLGADPIDPGLALAVVHEVGQGLQAMHQQGILHRDVKPANVLLRSADGDEGLRAVLGDLGLGTDMAAWSRLTAVAGTPAWVSPEQARGHAVDGRSDLYSLAAVAHTMLVGRRPFHHLDLQDAAAPTRPDLLTDLDAEHDLGIVAALGPDRAAAVARAVDRALARDPADRQATVAAFLDELGDVGPVDHARPSPRPSTVRRPAALPEDATRRAASDGPSRRRRVGYVAACVVVLLASGVAGWSVRWSGRPDVVRVEDGSGQLEATVPASWQQASGGGAWVVDGASRPGPSLSSGTSPSWAEDADGRGVFVAVVPGERLPETLPRHPGCTESARPQVDEAAGGAAARTQVLDCEGGGVLAERVSRTADGSLLWAQVRADGARQARDVLATVRADVT